MLDFATIRSVTIDIADSYSEGNLQDEAAEFILRLISQNYQIYLFSSNPKNSVALEEFEHPNLRFLREPMPPAPDLVEHVKDLVAEHNLWISDDPEIGLWTARHQLPLASRSQPEAAGARNVLRYRTLGEVAAALDSTVRVAAEIARLLPKRDSAAKPKACLIGIGGPPLSGQSDLASAVKQQLEAVGYDLVETLDLSALEAEESLQSESASHGRRRSLLDTVTNWLRQAKAGESFSVEALPPGFPQQFEAHLPLFVHGESVLIAFGVKPFDGELGSLFDVRVLLELDEQETVRRIYELDLQSQDAEAHELSYDRREYEAYLTSNRVRERATVRVDANLPGTFVLLPTG
jgi:hypothetical protein